MLYFTESALYIPVKKTYEYSYVTGFYNMHIFVAQVWLLKWKAVSLQRLNLRFVCVLRNGWEEYFDVVGAR